MAETLILLIFAFRPWAKRSFSRFLHFARGRNVDFAVFCISPVGETQILPISAFPPWRKRHFYHFPLIRGLGRTKTAKFGIDHTTENGKSRPAACGKQSPPRSRTMRSVGTGKISAKEMSGQIGVCAGINEMQNKSPVVLQPNQQPVHV